MAGRIEAAIDAFRRSIAIRPTAMAYYNLGTTLFYRQQYLESIAAFEQAVALNPSDAAAWGNLGNACRFIDGKEGRMREALSRAIALGRERLGRDPSSVDDWARIAGWLSNLDSHDEAIDAVARAVRAAPDDVRAMITAAHVFIRAGRRDDALHWLKAAVAHGHGVETLRTDPDLKILEGDPEFEAILRGGGPSRASADSVTNRRPS
jgi:tetratricopeptide (TPR) repeat protein